VAVLLYNAQMSHVMRLPGTPYYQALVTGYRRAGRRGDWAMQGMIVNALERSGFKWEVFVTVVG
jgi:hypothetical protein